MATINGRRIKLLKEDGQPIGTARGWHPESDWMKVITDDGITYMVHYTDKIEILPWYCWCGNIAVHGEKVCPLHESDLVGKP